MSNHGPESISKRHIPSNWHAKLGIEVEVWNRYGRRYQGVKRIFSERFGTERFTRLGACNNCQQHSLPFNNGSSNQWSCSESSLESNTAKKMHYKTCELPTSILDIEQRGSKNDAWYRVIFVKIKWILSLMQSATIGEYMNFIQEGYKRGVVNQHLFWHRENTVTSSFYPNCFHYLESHSLTNKLPQTDPWNNYLNYLHNTSSSEIRTNFLHDYCKTCGKNKESWHFNWKYQLVSVTWIIWLINKNY